MSGSGTPKPGYVIFFTYSHTGIVSGVDGGYVYTIEGNTSGDNSYERNGGCVYTKKRKIGDSKIKGYGITEVDVDVNVTNATADASSSGDSSSSTGTTTDSSGSKLDQLSSYLGSFFSEFGSRALTSDFSNTDYSSLLSDGSSSSDLSSSSDSSSDTSSAYSATEGATTQKKIWNFFRKNTDMTDTGIAGIMGNMKAESGFNPKNLQNSYESKLGYTDDSYTSAVDNGTYNNFVKDSAGYGLVQFTYYTLKQGLLNYAKKHNLSVGSEDAQLNYIYNDQKGGDAWKATKNASTPAEAAKQWMLKYEKPKNQSSSAITTRGNYATAIYNNRPSSGGSGTGLSRHDRYRVNNAKKRARGGYGASVSGTDSITSTTSSSYGISDYIKTTKDNTTQELLVNAIEILAAIAGSSAEASEKLNALKNISSTSSLTTVNNGKNITVNTTSSSSSKSGGSGTKSTKQLSAEQTARLIAKGGY
jgi:hypothetical protein